MKRKIVFIALGLLISFQVNAQLKSLSDSPMFKKDKVNLFLDSASRQVFTLPYMDSLYKTGKMKFQIYNQEARADSIYWKIRMIDTLPTIRPKWIGKQFPVANFTDMKGRKVSIADLHGKILIINCWSITCPPCILEIPQLNQIAEELTKDGVVCLALTFDKAEDISKFFKYENLKNNIKMPRPEFKFNIVSDQKLLLDKSLEVISYPTTFIVGRDGMIKEVFEGINLDETRKPKSYTEIMAAVSKL
jgi:thiol-disulfide isomerase/thioredoxin